VPTAQECNDFAGIREDYDSVYNAPDPVDPFSGCSIPKWKIFPAFNITHQLTPFHNAMNNGIVHFNQNPPFFISHAIDYINPDFCPGNEYSVEMRIQELNIARQIGFGLIHEDFGSPGGLKNFSVSLSNPASGNLIGTISIDQNVISLSDPALHVDARQWAVIKLEKKATYYNLYINGTLVKTVSFTHTYNSLARFSILTSSNETFIDWVKFYDSNNQVQYFEDFNNCQNFAKPSDAFRCSQGSCNSSFTNYFNQRRGTSYTPQQIDQLYSSCNQVGPCETAADTSNCPPQFITCCEPFTELEKFKQVFPDSTNARLLAVYFALQRTQWCAPVNLPNVNYSLPYDSLVSYFNNFKLANGYNITVRPDSLISYTVDNSASCTATALNFKSNPIDPNAQWYAVCNKPAQPIFAIDKNSCINEQVNIAAGNAHRDYLEYIIEIKRDYRDAYYTKCLSITPQLKLEAIYSQPLEYHYTLYYYDQAGNLVKTIPPAGVQPIDQGPDGAAKMQRVANYRLADKDYCYEYGDAPKFNGNAGISVADDQIIQQHALPFTLEARVNFEHFSGKQSIITKKSIGSDGNADGYEVYLENGRLKVALGARGKERWIQTLSKVVQYTFPDIYDQPISVNIRRKEERIVDRDVHLSVIAQITSDLSTLITAGQWAYIAVENTGDWKNPVRIYINGSLVNSTLEIDPTYDPADDEPTLTPAEVAEGTLVLGFEFRSTLNQFSVGNSADFVLGVMTSSPTGLNADESFHSREIGRDRYQATNSVTLTDGFISEPGADYVVEIVSNNPAETFGFYGSIKQVRLYNRLLTASEIRNNAFNTCLTPQSEGNLVLWLPLNREETVGSSLDRMNQYATTNVNTVFTTLYQPVYPPHKMPTHYYYNSLNAVTKQVTPDAGESKFWYDLLGRLVVSQNAEQLVASPLTEDRSNVFSYTKYDPLGRIEEVGEKTDAASMTNAIAKTDPNDLNSAINQWLTSGNDREITQTIYDAPNTQVVTNTAITSNQNIYNTSRKRVVATIYRETKTTLPDYGNATHYQYDINGNVKRLWQDYRKSSLGPVNVVRELEYDYDLVSGKVNHVWYQRTKGDQFLYKYEYDAENRLTKVLSGRDVPTLLTDATYKYYLHGPLARTELGHDDRLVQGIDYAYTLQGWLKGVNGVNLSNAPATNGTRPNDMGNDGSNLATAGLHATVAADAYAFSLGYHQNDYTPIDPGFAPAFGLQYQHPIPTSTATDDRTGKALFNGNISHATYAMAQIENGATRGYSYGYDQLNRIREMMPHDISSLSGNTWSNANFVPGAQHKESYTYDPNGNIRTLLRNGSTAGGRSPVMDNLSYTYYYYDKANTEKIYDPGTGFPADAWDVTNKLAHVGDQVASGAYPGAYANEPDIDDQGSEKYIYDRVGNLIKDVKEDIVKIDWNAYGKIKNISKSQSIIKYEYDASGNRIFKFVQSGVNRKVTFYMRDAQGNTIAVYSLDWNNTATPAPGTPIKWDEQHLYGSSRLGMWRPGITVPAILNPTTDATLVGSRLYELTNHLGNVMVTITDKRLSHSSNGTDDDYYKPEIISAYDYTPFGMQMVGRTFNAVNYRYGFNGKENDNEVKGGFGNQQDYGMRIYDPRLGRFLSVDPLTRGYPMLTPYQFASGNPIAGIDEDGLEFKYYRLAYWFDDQGNTHLKRGDLIKVENKKINIHAQIKIGEIDVPGGSHIDIGPKFNLSIDINDQIQTDFVSVDGKTWRAIPKDADINNLPHVENPVWGMMETDQDVEGSIKENLPELQFAINMATGLKKGGLNELSKNFIFKGRSGRQKRMKELMNDPKVAKWVRGWFRNELRRIQQKKASNMRMPGNSNRSKKLLGNKRGKELAHKHDKPAKENNDYDGSKLQDADLHKTQHRVENELKRQ
jgi:RHS repeat-associated protein